MRCALILYLSLCTVFSQVVFAFLFVMCAVRGATDVLFLPEKGFTCVLCGYFCLGARAVRSFPVGDWKRRRSKMGIMAMNCSKSVEAMSSNGSKFVSRR